MQKKRTNKTIMKVLILLTVIQIVCAILLIWFNYKMESTSEVIFYLIGLILSFFAGRSLAIIHEDYGNNR